MRRQAEPYQFELEGSATGQSTWAGPYLELLNNCGSGIAFDFDSGIGNNARITSAPTVSGIYYLVPKLSKNLGVPRAKSGLFAS